VILYNGNLFILYLFYLTARQMYIMKRSLIVAVFIFSFCSLYSQYLVDVNTPNNALPVGFEGVPDCTFSLDFSDEFSVNTIDSRKWEINFSDRSRAPRPGLKITDWRWKPENVSVGNGNLQLAVVKTGATTMTTGGIFSYQKYLKKYGYFEARVKIAEAAKGTHTAFWMNWQNGNVIDGTANDGAEIDIFESAWLENYTKAVLHIDGYGEKTQANTKRYETPGIHSGYHTYGLHWTKDFLKIYYDGVLKVTYNEPKWLVHVPEYLWLSDGASFGFNGENFASQPLGELTRAYFDYVRVWDLGEGPKQSSDFEIENLSRTNNGGVVEVINRVETSNGQHLRFSPSKEGDFMTLNGSNITSAGYYCVKFEGLTWNTFGKFNIELINDGKTNKFVKQLDAYGDGSVKYSNSFGPVYLKSGTVQIKIISAGKNTAATGLQASFDKVSFNQIDPSCSDPSMSNFCKACGGVDGCVISSVEESEVSGITVFPNPSADGIFNLSREVDFSLLNATGAVIYKGRSNFVDLRSHPKGLYLLNFGTTTKSIFRM
jgi:beta-glucanase (GH16 family)